MKFSINVFAVECLKKKICVFLWTSTGENFAQTCIKDINCLHKMYYII